MQAVLNITNQLRKISEKKFKIAYPGVTKTNHFYQNGLVTKNDFTYDLSRYYAIRIRVNLEKASNIRVSLDIVKNRSPKDEKHVEIMQSLFVPAGSNQIVTIPINCFSLPESETYFLRFVRGIHMEADAEFTIEEISFIKGDVIAVSCECQSKAAKNGQWVEYEIVLSNCGKEEQIVSLMEKKYGWQELEIQYPKEIVLKPYEEKIIYIKVLISQRICPGGKEEQTLFFVPGGQGEAMETITLTSQCTLPHPFVLVNEQELQDVREKIVRSDWAKDTYDDWYSHVDQWKAPNMNVLEDHLFHSNETDHLRIAAIIYGISKEKRFGLEVVEFLKRMSDPVNGYFRTYHAGHQEMVHEGEVFKNTAIAYDLVYDMEELTEVDHKNLEKMFRSAMLLFDGELRKGEISNWTLAELSGGLYMACVLQDYCQMNRFLYGVGAATEHLSKGTFSDGWWFEASIGYNLLCAGFFSEIAQVVSHFGIDFKHIQVPANYAKSVNSAESLKDGLVFDNWGENNKNYRNITMLWDSLIPYADYRGILFGINDSTEMKLVGITPNRSCPRYDLAYYLYGKQEYARIIRRLEPKERDLLFGPEVLEEVEDKTDTLISCYSDNAGVAVLRSKKGGRLDREQIQVGLKYGSHGGAHGHYDRVSMTNVMRYGRSLTNPENIWYSYHTFMYKFYVQNSINHNMVTVDLKLQDPKEPRRLLFHSGEKMQAIALENKSCWSNPPYGGWQVNNDSTFAQRTWNEGRFVPIPENPPEYSIRTDFTEPIKTRRLTVLTDDFVVNFDYAKGETIHKYDCIYHLHGLYDTNGLMYEKHTEQLEKSPLGSGQFITDCDWYTMEEGAKLSFQLEYNETKNNGDLWMCKNRTGHNESGVLKTDLYLAYPNKAEVIIGCDPEYQGVNKQLFYEVEGDGESLINGRFGAWILGKEKIDLDITTVNKLRLKVRVKQVEFEKDIYIPMEKSIFWGNPYIETKEGERIDLSQLELTYENTDLGYGTGIDYAKGPVKIQGELFEKAIPAEPKDYTREGMIQIDLTNIDAKRFVASIGSDYPVGEEVERRRTIVLRNQAEEARFITVLEPVEKDHLIKKVEAVNENQVVVYLEDKKVEIKIEGLDQERPSIQLNEWQADKLISQENA
jgi:hypothetical protein